MIWLQRITGGRPMEYISFRFVDRVSGKSVNLYRDYLGREWLASSRWGFDRIQRDAK